MHNLAILCNNPAEEPVETLPSEPCLSSVRRHEWDVSPVEDPVESGQWDPVESGHWDPVETGQGTKVSLEGIGMIRTWKTRGGHSGDVVSQALFPQENRKTQRNLHSLCSFLLHCFKIFYKSPSPGLTTQLGLTQDSEP